MKQSIIQSQKVVLFVIPEVFCFSLEVEWIFASHITLFPGHCFGPETFHFQPIFTSRYPTSMSNLFEIFLFFFKPSQESPSNQQNIDYFSSSLSKTKPKKIKTKQKQKQKNWQKVVLFVIPEFFFFFFFFGIQHAFSFTFRDPVLQAQNPNLKFWVAHSYQKRMQFLFTFCG